MKKTPSIMLTAATVLSAACLLIFSAQTVEGVRNGLGICADVVIPSLFPFTVLSLFTAKTGMLSHGRIAKAVTRIFRLPECAFPAVVFSFTGGYPVGLRLITQLFREDKITKKQACRMASFCVNAGPAFIINVIGTSVFSSAAGGAAVLISVMTSSVITGLVFSLLSKEKTAGAPYCVTEKQTVPQSLAESVSQAAETVINVCAWILAFSCISAAASVILGVSPRAYGVFGLIAEVTNGVFLSAETGGLPLCSAVTSFGGICVFFQLYPMLTEIGLSTWKYFLFRIINSVLSYCISLIFVPLFPSAVPTSAEFYSHAGVSSAPLSAAILLAAGLMMIFSSFSRDICIDIPVHKK